MSDELREEDAVDKNAQRDDIVDCDKIGKLDLKENE